MAKKAAATKEFSVEDKLRALHQLQIIDSEMTKLEQLEENFP